MQISIIICKESSNKINIITNNKYKKDLRYKYIHFFYAYEYMHFAALQIKKQDITEINIIIAILMQEPKGSHELSIFYDIN